MKSRPLVVLCPPSHMMTMTLAQAFAGIHRSVAPPLVYEPIPPMTRAEFEDVVAKMLRLDDLSLERAADRARARERFARMPRRFTLK